jgi:hypothetical protein
MRSTSTGTFAVMMAALAVVAAGCQNGDATAAPASSSVPLSVPSSVPSTPSDNGVAALTADEILQRAKAALKQAKSFRTKGSMVDAGQKTSVDLKVSGKDVAGSLSIGKAKVDLLAVGGQQYMRPNEQFWVMAGTGTAKQAQAVTELMGDRWVKVPAGDKDLADLFAVANIDDVLKPDGKLSKGKVKEVSGVPTIGLIDSGAAGGMLYIATTGQPYPIQLDGSDGAVMTFSNFGDTFADIKKPTASQTVDLSALQGK